MENESEKSLGSSEEIMKERSAEDQATNAEAGDSADAAGAWPENPAGHAEDDMAPGREAAGSGIIGAAGQEGMTGMEAAASADSGLIENDIYGNGSIGSESASADKNVKEALDQEKGTMGEEAVKEKKKGSELFAWIRDIVVAIVIALIISRFITPTIVQEHSMDDTLHNNDYLILWKMAYVFDEPDYGDIVVFRSNLLNEKGEKKLLIKRVVAKGGDKIALNDGYVYRNGQQLTELYTKDGYTHGYIEETVVPEGQLFLLGDNRAVSVDSRDPSVGFVDEDLLEGKAVLRLYPFDQMGGLYKNMGSDSE